MKKGQLSLDLLLTLVVAIIFFNLFIVQVDGLGEKTLASGVESSLKAIRSGVYSAGVSAKALGSDVLLRTGTISFSGSEGTECTIEVGSGASGFVRVTGTTESGSIIQEYRNINLEGVSFSRSSFPCGEEVRVSAT